jgi:hypothetical protein
MQQVLSKQVLTKTAAMLVALAATIGLIGFSASAEHGSGNTVEERGYQMEQCKNGGWEEMGYSNQGQCVSHFASDGRH